MVKGSTILILDAYEQGELFRIITTNGDLTVAKRPNDKIFFHICYKGMFSFSYEPKIPYKNSSKATR